jgi:hypothetical protein
MDSDDETPDKQKQSGTPAPTPLSRPLDTPQAQPATAAQFQAVEQRMTAFESSSIRLAQVAIAASILAAIFVCAQWYEMHTGGTDTHELAVQAKAQADKMKDMSDAAEKIRQAAENLVIQDQRIADKAKESLEAANAQNKRFLNVTIENSHLDQRPWVGATNYAYEITGSSPLAAVVQVINMGKSPALGILCRVYGATKTRGDILKISDIEYPANVPIVKQGTILPTQHFLLNSVAVSLKPGQQKDLVTNIQSGDWVQYFYGEVRYRDIFGRSHWMHFCSQYLPATKSGTPCAIYNDTDGSK